MRARKTFLVICFAGLLLAVTAVASELALRVSGHISTASIHAISNADFVRVPGMFEPNQSVEETPHPKLHYHATINSLGYRGPEFQRIRPPHVVRILCLGDSGTFGQFVNDEETLSANLERMLQQEGISVEVINGGVPGTTIVDQVEILQRSLSLAPDIVILTFSENDITDLEAEPSQFAALAENRRVKGRTGLKTVYELVRDTALFNYFLKVRATWNTYSAPHVSTGVLISSPEDSETRHEQLWANYSHHLEIMLQSLSSRNVRFIFNGYPTHQRIGADTFTDDRSRVQLSRAEALARNMGITTVSLLPSFRETRLTKEELYHLPYDGHANRMGYLIQAKALLPAVRESIQEVRNSSPASRP
ncbi:MAG: GDSL-type esterase/lipase family protein [Nitrospira sp.]|jgi:hypothetical protein|nr:MAG: hypothetical protein E8D44_13995 [Nitrospira sp.]